MRQGEGYGKIRMMNNVPTGNKTSSPLPKFARALIVYLSLALLVLFGLSLVGNFLSSQNNAKQVDLSQGIQDVMNDKVEKAVVSGNTIELHYRNGLVAKTFKESQTSFIQILQEAGLKDPAQKIQIEIENSDALGFWTSALGNVFWLVLFVGLMFVLSRQFQRQAGTIFSFGRSGARLFDHNQSQITFNDVAGVEEAQQELREVVDFLKNPGKYLKLGARIPKGVLLVGPAGVGKTLLARAVAGEASVPFYSMAGSEFVEMIVGVGSARVRDLFSVAKKSAPSIVFIDEIESIGRQRGFALSGSHAEHEQTLNQILVEMDGFSPNTNVIILAATNRPDLLDPALTRPGRFDRRIVLELPDIKGREGIFKIHMRGKPLEKSINLEKLAQRTVGFSGADIENMLNEAAILAARAEVTKIREQDLEEAATKVKLGPQRRRLQSKEDKKITAYHEAGHAIVAACLPHMDPVHRVSIVARGLALGYTQIFPQIDRSHQTKTRLLEMITTLLGGRAAEFMVFNEMTVGAGQDLETANQIARKMVTEFGMSELGPLAFQNLSLDERGFLMGMTGRTEYSEDMAARIDEQVKKILDECLARAQKTLVKQREVLDQVALKLAEQETLEGDEFQKILSSVKTP